MLNRERLTSHWKQEPKMETHHSLPKDLAKKIPPGAHPSLGTAGFTAVLCRCSNCDIDFEQNVEMSVTESSKPLLWELHSTGTRSCWGSAAGILKPLSLSHIFMQQEPFTLITCRWQYPLQHSFTLLSSKNVKVDILKVKIVFNFMSKRWRILIRRTFKTP